MEKIKLYTEEQMKDAMRDARISPSLKIDFLLEGYTPIELPSEEEIEKYVLSHKYDDMFENLIEQGAKWILERIKQQAE